MKNVKIAILALGLFALNSFAMQKAEVIEKQGNTITVHGRSPSGHVYVLLLTYDPITGMYEGSLSSEERFSKYMSHEDLSPQDAKELYNEILEEIKEQIEEQNEGE